MDTERERSKVEMLTLGFLSLRLFFTLGAGRFSSQ